MCLWWGVNHELIQHDRIINACIAIAIACPLERKKKEKKRSGRSVNNRYKSQMTVWPRWREFEEAKKSPLSGRKRNNPIMKRAFVEDPFSTQTKKEKKEKNKILSLSLSLIRLLKIEENKNFSAHNWSLLSPTHKSKTKSLFFFFLLQTLSLASLFNFVISSSLNHRERERYFLLISGASNTRLEMIW